MKNICKFTDTDLVIHNFMDDNQQSTSSSQSSGEQSGETQQQAPAVTIDLSNLRPSSTDTSSYSQRTQNNEDLQTKVAKDE